MTSLGGQPGPKADAAASALWHDVLSSIGSPESVEKRWIGCLRAIYPEMTLVEITSRFVSPWRVLLADHVALQGLSRHLTIAAPDLPGWQALPVALREGATTRSPDLDALWLGLAATLNGCVGTKWRPPAGTPPESDPPSASGLASTGSSNTDWHETSGMVGSSPVMLELAQRCSVAGRDDYPALILGETGVGKEVAARLIHHFSDSPGRFVALNCAALPEPLIESELFGHVRGAFTGARGQRDGLFHEAEKGTLLLDEISEIPTHQQAKVLRALQDGLVRRVGSSKHEHIDVRVVGTSNRDLRDLLDRGSLRRDLYYRLAVHEIVVPPLREHLEDVPELTAAFLARWRLRHPSVPLPVVSPQGLQALRQYRWPGNVRELEHIVYRLASSHPGESVGAQEVNEALGRQPEESQRSSTPPRDLLNLRLDDTERSAVEKALRLTDGNKSAAARLLGVSRKTIYNKIRRYGLD